MARHPVRAIPLLVAGVFLTAVMPVGAAGSSGGGASGLLTPTPRCCMGMAYDAARGQVVVFGGQNRATQYEFRDTWTWDGTAWTRQNPDLSPQTRSWMGIAYHALTERTVVVDGEDSNNTYRDLWVWDGTAWQRELTQPSPPRRSGSGMAYDELRGEAVMFGGWQRPPTGDVYYHDTWTWDGTLWTHEPVSGWPPGRYALAIAYDAARDQTLLFGGIGEGGVFLGDTWAWDGNGWTRLLPASSPGARAATAMTYDAARGEIVLFGGFRADGSVLNDTWVWDGTTWTQRQPGLSPPPRYWAGMAFDTARSETVLFGGSAPDGEHGLGDTWVWDGATWSPRPG